MGYAAQFAAYLAAQGLGWAGEAGEATAEDGVITVCYPVEPGEAERCTEFSDFVVVGGTLETFSAAGYPLSARMWPESQMACNGWCHRGSAALCDFDHPESDTVNTYIAMAYAHFSTSLDLVVVWEVQNGERDLDIVFETADHPASYMTDAAGVRHYASWCGSPAADHDPRDWDLRMSHGETGFLTCAFPGLEPGGDTRATVTLETRWDDRYFSDPFELEDLPD